MIFYVKAMFFLYLAIFLINVCDLLFSSSEEWPRSRSESLPKRFASILILLALATWSGIAAFHSNDVVQHCCSCHCNFKEASK